MPQKKEPIPIGKGMTAVVRASELRKIDNRRSERMKDVPERAGWYRWWAPKAVLERLLNDDMKELWSHLQEGTFEGKPYFYIYVGITHSSLQDRLNWHVNQKHSESAVRTRYLSTLRQSISSLVDGNQKVWVKTNDLIDKLLIEYRVTDNPIEDENKELENYVLPLNIQKNKKGPAESFIRYLKKVRKEAREKALEEYA